MLIGRREDFIEKMERACAAWRWQDVSLALYARGATSLLQAVLQVEDNAEHDISIYDPDADAFYDDQLLCDCYELITRRDLNLRSKVIKYFEARDPHAAEAQKHQLTMFD